MPRKTTAPQETLRPGQVGDYWLSQKRNSPFWQRTWYDPKTRQTKRESSGYTNFHEAQAALVEWVANHGLTWDGTDPENVKLADVLNWNYTTHAHKLAGAGSIRTCLGYWLGFFGDDAVIADLKKIKLDEFIEKLRSSGYSEGYIAIILQHGRTALNRAEGYELLSRAPRIPYNRTSEEAADAPPKGRPLTLAEMARLLTLPWKPRYQTFLGIMLNTACRPGAALSLAKPQIDYEHGLVDLNPKGRKQTKKRRPIIPLTDPLRRMFMAVEAQAIADQEPSSEPFRMGSYVSWKGGAMRHYNKTFRTQVDAAGFESPEDITAYSFRHTVSRELRKARVDTEEISVWLGHRPRGVSMTTGIYAPYEPDFLSNAKAAIEAYVIRINAEIERQREDIQDPRVSVRVTQKLIG